MLSFFCHFDVISHCRENNIFNLTFLDFRTFIAPLIGCSIIFQHRYINYEKNTEMFYAVVN